MARLVTRRSCHSSPARSTKLELFSFIYGWQPGVGQGMAPDPELEAWVSRQEPDAELEWLDLLGGR